MSLSFVKRIEALNAKADVLGRDLEAQHGRPDGRWAFQGRVYDSRIGAADMLGPQVARRCAC